MMNKSYSKLIQIPSFEDRYRYLKLDGTVGVPTFGFERYLNQMLYHSGEWRRFRDRIILRDSGCDLGCIGFEIYGQVTIHHINPITCDDIIARNPCVFDEENVICTKHSTHMAIHYGDESLLLTMPEERRKNDTCPWKH